MVDCKGVQLNLNDMVVYVKGKNSLAELDTGLITKFYKNQYGEEECSVGRQAHLKSNRVMKLL